MTQTQTLRAAVRTVQNLSISSYEGLYPPSPLPIKLQQAAGKTKPVASPPNARHLSSPPPSPTPKTEQVREHPTGRSGEVRKSPAAEKWAKVIAAACVDVVSARKDARSLKRWVTPDVYTGLTEAKATAPRATHARTAQAVTARVYVVDERNVEFAVTVWDHDKHRAVAGRLAKLRNRWLATALEIG